jgi:hypothetical protein
MFFVHARSLSIMPREGNLSMQQSIEHTNAALCRLGPEMKKVNKARHGYRKLDLVLIATDNITSAREVYATLSKHGLGDVESWIFADPNAQRLRYEIDPRWYGELPRSYFYAAEHKRVGLRGALKPEQLKVWLESLQP